MNKPVLVTAVAFALFCTNALAQSPFEGTWRLDPERVARDAKLQVIQLLKGEYDCRLCNSPQQTKADGLDHRVSGAPLYDTLRVVVINDHTIVETGKRAGITASESTLTVSSDGSSLTEHQILSLPGGRKLDFTKQLSRVSPGPKGSHAVSGTWRVRESGLTGHDDDTTFRVNAGVLSMSDRMGESFSAKLDGTEASYKGSAVFTTVSVKQIDDHTLVETDRRGKQVVRVNRWVVDPDGATLHVRFENHGQVVQETARRLPAP